MLQRKVMAVAILLLAMSPLAAADPVSFRGEIAPLLLAKCVACHGSKKAEGGYRVDTYQRAIQPGESGGAGFAAGKPDASESLRRLATDDKKERMPKDAEPLKPETVALFRRWVEEGAKFDGGPDPNAPLAAIVPPPTHPDPPEKYPQPVGISGLAFSRDGQEIYAGGYHELTVWSATDGKLLRRIKNIGQRTYRIAPNADGTQFAVAGGAPGRHGEVRLVEASTGNIVRVFGGTSDVMYDAAFDPEGKRIAAGGADSLVRVFDVATGDTLLSLQNHSDWILAVAWSADGTKLASASRDKTAKVFDAKGSPLITYSGHNQPVRGIAFGKNPEDVFTAGGDFKIHRWKIADGRKAADVASFDDDVFKLVAAGDFLFAPSADKTARQFKLDDGGLVRTYKDHSGWLMSAAYHPETKRVATGAFNGEICVWNAENGELVTKFIAAPGK